MNITITEKKLYNEYVTINGRAVTEAPGPLSTLCVTSPEHGEMEYSSKCINEENLLSFSIKVNIKKIPRFMLTISNSSKSCSVTFSDWSIKRDLALSKKEKLLCMAKDLKASEDKKEFIHQGIIYSSKFMDIRYGSWYKKHKASSSELKAQKNTIFDKMPLISLVVPVYLPKKEHLKALVNSVLSQSYSKWQLCLVNGSGMDKETSRLVYSIAKKDPRIKTVRLKNNLGISGNTNIGIQISDGDWIAFADQDDVLEPNAFYEYVKAINSNDEIDALYCDEDKLDDETGRHFMPNFKPDFNLDFLLGVNYICHMFMVKASILEKAGYLRSEFDGAQDHDLILRCSRYSRKIEHISKILYSWRSHAASTAQDISAKSYIMDAGKQAILDYYMSRGINASVNPTEYGGIYRSDFSLSNEPLVSIMIPNKDHSEDLIRCVNSFLQKSIYQNFEIIIIENNSELSETFNTYENLCAKDSRIRVITFEGAFNFSAINNLGAKNANGQYLLLLNNDTELISPDLLNSMCGYLQREEVGIVGPKLYYPDGKIQHAGMLIGVDRGAHHVFLNQPCDAPGYMARAFVSQNMSGVTGACMLVKRDVYMEVGGFDEAFTIAYNDVDFCLKTEKAGYLCVYDAFVAMTHFESKSRGYEQTDTQKKRFEAETELLKKKWDERLNRDPFYNDNLGLRWGYYNIP